MRLLCTSASMLAFAAMAAAQTTISVNPSIPMPLIQQIIDTSGPNTTIVFAAGTYFGHLSVNQDIVLQGAGASTTTIDAQSTNVSVLTFAPGVTRSTIVSGFRLTGGLGDPTTSSGGGIHCTDAAPIVRNCFVTNNSANVGGGVYVYGQLAGSTGRSLQMEDCFIVANFASNTGAGIHVTKAQNGSPGAPARFVRCQITDNLAQGAGGGASIRAAANPTFERCIVQENLAQRGGGIDWYEGCAPVITSCLINANAADTGGGINYRESGAAIIEHTSITNNAAVGTGLVEGGGGMNGFLDSTAATVVVRNCLFAYNQATQSGGAILLSDSAPTLRFVTIADNFAAGATGGLFYRYSGATTGRFALRNSIVWGNLVSGAPTLAANLAGTDAAQPPIRPTLDHCDVQFGATDPILLPPGSGNIDADPLFVLGYTCNITPLGQYFLAQVPQGVNNNPCVDSASSGPGSPVIVGRSTRTDGRPDGGVLADRGFHYPVPGCP